MAVVAALLAIVVAAEIVRAAAVRQCGRRHPACGLEIAAGSPPYRGVRGQGVAGVATRNTGDYESCSVAVIDPWQSQENR